MLVMVLVLKLVQVVLRDGGRFHDRAAMVLLVLILLLCGVCADFFRTVGAVNGPTILVLAGLLA